MRKAPDNKEEELGAVRGRERSMVKASQDVTGSEEVNKTTRRRDPPARSSCGRSMDVNLHKYPACNNATVVTWENKCRDSLR